MKNIQNVKHIFLIFLTFFSLYSNSIFSQTDFISILDCPMTTTSEVLGPGLIGGLYKPHRTDSSGGGLAPNAARLNVIVVFVEFANETIPSSEWPIGQAPVYKDDLFA